MAEDSHAGVRRFGSFQALGRYRPQLWALTKAWWGLPVSAALGLIAATIYVLTPHVVYPIFDDSFISLTFARNLAEHGKLSFDGRTWSTGATSPLHVFILAGVIKLGADPLQADVWVGVFWNGMLGAGVYLLAWSIFRSQLAGVLSALIISFICYTALDAGNGLETTMFMALIAFTMASFFLNTSLKGRLVTGVLLALCVWTRPEGGFLVPALIVYRWIDRAPGERLDAFVKDALLIGGPPAIAFAMLSGYYLIVSDTLGGTASAKLRFFQDYAQPLQRRISLVGDNLGLFAGPLFTLLALAFFAPRRRELTVFALFWVPVIVTYTFLFPGGLLHYFYRYQHPALPLLAVMAGGGAAQIIAYAMRRDVAVKLLVVMALLVAAVPVWKQYQRWRDIYSEASRETHDDLAPMARDLNTIIGPNQVLAAHDIGAVGYFADYKVEDLVGLVNPDVIPFHKGRRVKDYVEATRPDYLLIFQQWDTDFLHIDAANDPRFKLVKVYKGGPIRQSDYLLYRINWE